VASALVCVRLRTLAGEASTVWVDGAIIFRDIAGRLDVLTVERDTCGRRGRYHLHWLIERYGIDAKLFDWFDEITADCAAQNFERPVRRAMSGRAESGVSARVLLTNGRHLTIISSPQQINVANPTTSTTGAGSISGPIFCRVSPGWDGTRDQCACKGRATISRFRSFKKSCQA
jgi:hypothetical protein